MLVRTKAASGRLRKLAVISATTTVTAAAAMTVLLLHTLVALSNLHALLVTRTRIAAIAALAYPLA